MPRRSRRTTKPVNLVLESDCTIFAVQCTGSAKPFKSHYCCCCQRTLSPQTAKTSHKKPDDEKRLSKAIEQILSDPDVARGFWGIDVVALDTGQPLFGLNENRLFTPASNTKLFTTAAAFGLIGPEFRFKTTVESMGSLDKYGRLNSDLVVVGRGDPNLSGRTLPYYLHTERKTPPIQALIDLADQLVQKGLKYVDGDVVADDSYYVFERYGEGWSQDDLAWEWGAPVSALTINDNVLFVNILPADRPGEKAFLNVTPFPGVLPHRESRHHNAARYWPAQGLHQSRAGIKSGHDLGQHSSRRLRRR